MAAKPHVPPPRPPYKPPSRNPKSQRSNLASCIVATVFLIFIITIILIIYFSLFIPKPPSISVNAVQFPSFSLSNGSVNFTFSQYVSVRNPNRAAFSHFDSSLQLLYSGNQVGFMFIPAGVISAGRTEFMATTFSVESFPIFPVSTPAMPGKAVPEDIGKPAVTDGIDRVAPTLEIESKMEMAGRVRVLRFFTHHVDATADCRVTVAINDGSVLGFHC